MPTKAPSRLAAALCLVLRANTYSEADYILTLFSREQGLLTARAYGAKSLKSAVRAACQPFCVAEFEFYVRGERLSVKAAAIRAEFYGLQENYDAYVCGCIILEITEKVLRYADEFEELFQLTVAALSVLSSGTLPPKGVLLFYLLRLTNHLGVFPVLRTCSCCGIKVTPGNGHWSSAEGGIVCASCAKGRPVRRVSPAALSCLARYGRRQLRDLSGETAPAAAVDETCRLLIDYLNDQYGIQLRTASMLPREAD